MEVVFRAIAGYADLTLEFAAVTVLVIGAAEAMLALARAAPHWPAIPPRGVWARFASWLVLGLEFTLAGDIVRTAIAPTWNDIGQLGAVAAIRIALNLSLERDIVALQTCENRAGAATLPPAEDA